MEEEGYYISMAKQKRYRVLRITNAAAVLIEVGNIKNVNNSNIIKNDKFVERMVKGIDKVASEVDKKRARALVNSILGILKKIFE